MTEHELTQFIAAWHAAWFAKDAAAVAAMTAADYVYVAPNGMILDRAAIVGIVEDPTYGLSGGTHDQQVVMRLGSDVALVRHRWRGTGSYQGRQFTDDHRCITVCERTGNGWLIRFEQCAAIVV